MIIQAIFFDRDGTLGDNANIEFPWHFVPFDCVNSVFRDLHNLGVKVYIFTNQSCIARGKDNGYDFAKEFASYGADNWYICPHDNGDNCNCRKPKTGLLQRAMAENDLDLSKCIVVGDRETDINSGIAMGCVTVLTLTGRGAESIDKCAKKPDCIISRLEEVVNFVKKLIEKSE